MKELLIKIKALFEGSGTAAASTAIKKVGEDAAQAKGKLGGLSGIFGNLTNSAKLWAAGLAAGAGATLVSLGSASIQAFRAAEVEQAKLDAALANSGKLTDEYREKLSRLASVRSQATGIDDEGYLKVFSTLTKFGADTSNIESYTRAVENLAGFLDGDMDQAAFLFGKAMQGSTEMLGRYGISVDKSKSQTEQLADIMRQLDARGGGQLEAMGATLEGSFNKAKNSWENLLESLGSSAEKSGLAAILSNWASGVQIIADKLGGSSAPKSQNREELFGASPEAQEAAEEIAIQRRDLERVKADLLAARPELFAKQDLGDSRPFMSTQDSAAEKLKNENSIAWNDATLAKINHDLKALDEREKAFGLKRGTPAEAQAAREIDIMRRGTVELSPGGSPEDIAKAQENFEKTSANAEKQQLQVDKLSRKSAEEYEKQQEISAQKASQLELETRIAEAKAAGDQPELKKLEWLREYNRLMADGFREDQARRAANASSADSPDKAKGTRGGDLVSGSNRRRGATESDAFGENALNLVPGQSLLDQYKQNRDRAVGAVGGQSILGNDPKTSVAGGNDAGSKVAEAGKEAGNVAKEAGDAAAGAVRELGSTMASSLQAIQTAVAGVKSQISALASKV